MLLLLVLLLAACGNGSSDPAQASAKAADKPAAVSETSAAPEAAAAGTKKVQNVLGEIEIPLEPKRIVSVNLEDMLLSLEVPLVLATPVARQDYLNAKLEEQGVEIAPLADTVNFEAVLAAQPDLIVASSQLDEAAYAQLQKIAPTIAFSRSGWRDSLPELGAALGLEDRAAAVLGEHEKRIAAARKEIEAYIGSGETAAFLRVQEEDMRLFFPSILEDPNPYAGYVSIAYEGLGLKAPQEVLKLQQESPDKQNVPISQELLPDLTADRLFVVALSADGSTEGLNKTYDMLAELEQGAIWNAVPAVKSGQVYMLNMKNWLIDGPQAETLKINELLSVLKSAGTKG